MAAALAVVLLTLLVSWSLGHPLSATDRVLRAVAASTVTAPGWRRRSAMSRRCFDFRRRYRRRGERQSDSPR
jgi:phosphate/sulfate permease